MKSPETEAEVVVETTLEEDLAAAMAEHNPAPAEEPVEAAEPALEPEPSPEAAEVAPEAPAAEEEAPIIPDRYGVAPQHAKKAVREHWEQLPPEVRKALHERESEAHKELTRHDEDRNFGKRVKEVVGPYEQFIRGLGADPIQAVDYLIKSDYALRTAAPEARRAMLVKVAKDYGIDLGLPDQPSIVDPRVETLQQRLERLEQERSSDIQSRQLEEQRSIEQQIADFSSKPENVYFDRVSPVMASLLSSGQAGTLEQAYDMAVFADPETRALQLAAQRAAEESKRKSQNQAQVVKAKSASASVTGAPGIALPASTQNSAGSLEDDIRLAIQSASGRV